MISSILYFFCRKCFVNELKCFQLVSYNLRIFEIRDILFDSFVYSKVFWFFFRVIDGYVVFSRVLVVVILVAFTDMF